VAGNAIRVAAWISVTVAGLLIGSPAAAVALADPGGPGEHSNPGGQNHQPDRGANPDPANGPATTRGSDNKPGPKPNTPSGPVTRIGNGRPNTIADPPTVPPGGRGPTQDQGPSGSSDSPYESGDTPDAPQVPPTHVGNGRSVRDEPAATPPPLQTPTPVEWAPPAPPPLPPVVVTPAPDRSWVDRASSVLQQMKAAQPDPLTSPLLGLAGLVLLPAAAAVLGYRQARAAQKLRMRPLP
jgi:hypothetical protein